MKKFIVFTSLLLIGLLLLTGCGDNKKKAELFGLTNTATTVTSSALDTQLATTAEALYTVAGVGAGAGTTSFGVPGRRYVGTNMDSLGEADDEGFYTITAPGLSGITCKLQFKKGSEVVYFNMEQIFGQNMGTLQLYPSDSLTSTPVTLADMPTTNPILLAAFFPKYIPAMFCKLDGTALAWHTIAAADVAGDPTNAESTILAALVDFINANFPDTMENTVTGRHGGATIALSLTAEMPANKPTDADPAELTGSGTVTLDTGEILTIVSDVTVGANGPIGGTQTFESTTSGLSGVLTFHTDQTLTGTISRDGVAIATIAIAADGTGTLTNIATGAVTAI